MPTTSDRSPQRSVPTWLYVAALIGTGAAARLPQLLSRNLLLEGDECILGLMARHLAAGREFPLFFYGQRYGLAVVEAPAAALSFLLFGAGAVPLKIAMLAIWLAGIVFYFLAFLRPLGATRSFWITMVLVLMPAWAATSMKAWSGYITAFAATAVAMYVITRNDNRKSFPWVFAGAVAGVIYFAQPLWLPSLLPIVLFYLASGRRLAFWVAFASGAVGAGAAIAAVMWLWLAHAPETWTRPPAGNPHLLTSAPQLLNQMYVNLTGSYYFGTADVPRGCHCLGGLPVARSAGAGRRRSDLPRAHPQVSDLVTRSLCLGVRHAPRQLDSPRVAGCAVRSGGECSAGIHGRHRMFRHR